MLELRRVEQGGINAPSMKPGDRVQLNFLSDQPQLPKEVRPKVRYKRGTVLRIDGSSALVQMDGSKNPHWYLSHRLEVIES